ncbi:hypothetical protein ABMA08_17875 [Pseudomonas yamanorum]
MASAAGLSLAFAGNYLAAFIDVSPSIAAPVFLVMIALLNARGVKESLGANVVMTVIEVSGLLCVTVAAGGFFRSGEANFDRALEFKAGVNPVLGMLSGVLPIHLSASRRRPIWQRKFNACVRFTHAHCLLR